METLKTNRRDFLKLAATTSGGLMLGFSWGNASAMEVIDEATFAADVNFNSYLSIAPSASYSIFKSLRAFMICHVDFPITATLFLN